MELEDALTIFSYSSPYPLQLSLLPATTATSPAPRPQLGCQRSRSLDQLDYAARRQRPHGVGREARSHSEGRQRQPDVTGLPASETSVHEPRQEPPSYTVQSLHPDQRQPADGDENSSVNTDNLPVDVNNMDYREVRTSTEPMSANQHTESLKAVVDGAETLSASSPDVASSGSNTGVTVGTENERNRADEHATIVIEGELGLCHYQHTYLNKTPAADSIDEMTSSLLLQRHHLQHPQQQETKEKSGEADHVKTAESNHDLAGDLEYNGGESSEQRSVESESTRPTTDDQSSEVFFDDTEDHSSDTQRPAAKKKRGWMGSLKALVKSSSSKSRQRYRRSSSIVGGAVPYPDDEQTHPSTSQTQQQIVVYVDEPSDAENSNSVDHDGKSRYDVSVSDQYNTLSEQFASEARELQSAAVDEVLTTASDGRADAKTASSSRPQCNSDQLDADEPQVATTADGSDIKQRDRGQSGFEDIELVTFEARDLQATVSVDRNGSNLPVTDIDNYSKNERDVVQSEFVENEISVASLEEAGRRTTRDDDDLQVIKDVRYTTSEAEMANIQPHPSTIFKTDDDATSHDMVDGVDVQQATTTERVLVSPDVNVVSLSDKGADICELSPAKTNFDAAASTRSEFESCSSLQQETIGGEDNTNSRSTAVVVGDDDEMHGTPLSVAESPQQHSTPDRQRLDIVDDDLRHSVVIQVAEPAISASTPDVSETVSATTYTPPQVVKDKRSSEIDLGDVTAGNLRQSVIVDVTEPTISKSTSDLRDDAVDTRMQFLKDKRLSESELYKAANVTDDIPSVLTMLLNLFGARDEKSRVTEPADDHRASSGHCMVAMETPTTTSGGIKSSPVVDDVMESVRGAAGMNSEDNKRERAAADEEAVDSVFETSESSFSEQSPPQNRHDLPAGNTSLADQYFGLTSCVRRTTAEETLPDSALTLSADDILTRLAIADYKEVMRMSTDSSHRERDLLHKHHYGDRSTTAFLPPTVSNERVEHPALVMGRNHPGSPRIVDGERVSQTTEKFSDKETRTHDDSAHVVMGDVEESKNQTFSDQSVQRPHVAGVPVVRRNKLSKGTAPPRNVPLRPLSSDFTFVVQRQMRADNYERSLSTGSTYNTGSSNGGGEPAYTFVMPTVRRRSDSDHNNNESSTTRRFSQPQTVSDGRKSDIDNATTAIPRYTLTKSSAYNSWQAVDIAVHRSIVDSQLSVRTGSGNIFDRKQIDSATVHGRLSESAGELTVSGARLTTVDETRSSLVADHVTAVAGHVTSSVPDLTSASSGMEEFLRSESCLDVSAGEVADDGVRPTDARCHAVRTGGTRGSWADQGDVHTGAPLPVQLRGISGTSSQHVARRRPRRRRVASLTQNPPDEPNQSQHTPTRTTTSCPTSSSATDT